jgi:hypothetical protein
MPTKPWTYVLYSSKSASEIDRWGRERERERERERKEEGHKSVLDAVVMSSRGASPAMGWGWVAFEGVKEAMDVREC